MSLVKSAGDKSLEELANQIKNNTSMPITKESSVRDSEVRIRETAKTAEPVTSEIPADSESKPKSRYSDTVNLNLPVGKRNEIKEFFNTYHLSMTQGILFAINYLKEDVKSGKVEISKLGVERK